MDQRAGRRKRKTVVLLSGGLDSATAMAITRARGDEVYALTVRYGQRHRHELRCARRLARALGAAGHLEIGVDLDRIGGSALTSRWIPVPKDRLPGRAPKGIPLTYVPARNTVLLAIALAWAEVVGAERIVIGANVLDYSGYPDCRPRYLRAFQAMARLASKAAVEGRLRTRIDAPLLRMTKARIIQLGSRLGVPFKFTHSCYDPGPRGAPCGRCDSCRLRQKGFEEAGLEDPLRSAQRSRRRVAATPPRKARTAAAIARPIPHRGNVSRKVTRYSIHAGENQRSPRT